eukprot:366546-Chlamydomonas_euryale.AAC.47
MCDIKLNVGKSGIVAPHPAFPTIPASRSLCRCPAYCGQVDRRLTLRGCIGQRATSGQVASHSLKRPARFGACRHPLLLPTTRLPPCRSRPRAVREGAYSAPRSTRVSSTQTRPLRADAYRRAAACGAHVPAPRQALQQVGVPCKAERRSHVCLARRPANHRDAVVTIFPSAGVRLQQWAALPDGAVLAGATDLFTTVPRLGGQLKIAVHGQHMHR